MLSWEIVRSRKDAGNDGRERLPITIAKRGPRRKEKE
jgi:hypothetical protein